jgi:hypothetical protein
MTTLAMPAADARRFLAEEFAWGTALGEALMGEH